MIDIIFCITQYVYIAGNNTVNQLGSSKNGFISTPEYFLYPFNITYIESNGKSSVFYSSLQETIYTSGISTVNDSILFSREHVDEIQFARRFLFRRNNYQITQMTMTNTTTYVVLSNNLIVKSVTNGDMQPLNFNADNTEKNFTICGTSNNLWMLKANGTLSKLNKDDTFEDVAVSLNSDEKAHRIQCYENVVILSAIKSNQQSGVFTIYAITDSSSSVSICGQTVNNSTFTKLNDNTTDQYIGETSQLFIQVGADNVTQVMYCGINVFNNSSTTSLTSTGIDNKTEQFVAIGVQKTAWYVMTDTGYVYIAGKPNNDNNFKYVWQHTDTSKAIPGFNKYMLSFDSKNSQTEFNKILVKDDVFIFYHNNTKNYFHNYPEASSLIQIFVNVFIGIIIIGYIDILIRWIMKTNTIIDINLQVLTFAVEERKKQIEEEEQALLSSATVEINADVAAVQGEETSNLNAGTQQDPPK